jgi:hypothetical protein
VWWMIGLSFASCLVVLVLLGRRNERVVRRDWQLLLTPRGETVYHSIESRMKTEMALADVTYDEAFAVKALGSAEEAKRLLDVGYKVIERFCPSMLQLLSTMARFSRMVSAMAPVTPLRPRDFRLTELASLAYLNGLVHRFLVSTSERFRLRLYILGQSFGLAARVLLRSTRRIVGNEPEADRDWEQIEAVRQDFQTLTRDSLDSLRVLLTSLAVERREDVLRSLEEKRE